MKWYKIILITILMSLHISNINAATLLIDSSGALIGAKNVDVSGSLYNVSFQDGSCNSLFNGCTNYTFTDFTSATAASQALLDQVLLGVYDTDPGKTNGIESIYDGFIYTVYGTSNLLQHGQDLEVFTRFIQNINSIGDIGPRTGIFNKDLDLTLNMYQTYAVWTPVSAVPVPASVWLLGSGLLSLIGMVRRKKA